MNDTLRIGMSSAPGTPTAQPLLAAAGPKPTIPDYELVRIVGRGSYGDVWLARSVTGAWRAIKIVWRERFTTVEPFEREFRGLKEFADVCLGESSQMTLLHVGRNDAAGFFYSVMELADDAERGRNIDPVTYVPLTLAELRARRGRIPADECARIGCEVARGLASLHRRGLVHRDVKPSNVIFVSGLPKLADVGLVAPSASAHTFVGTEGFVPPEGPGSPGADVFALGKVLYELSTGHDRQEFPKLPAGLARLPDRAALLELNEIFLRACGPTPAERYRDGAAILADLTALNAGVSLRTRRFARFVVRAAAVVAVIAGLGFAGWYLKTNFGLPFRIAAGVSANSVAVLPFSTANGDPTQDYFAEGISDEILHALERERDLWVTGSRSSFWCKDQKLPTAVIARRLHVAHLVEGSLQRNGTRIRIDVRLTRGVDGVSEKLDSFERDASDVREVFALEEEIARAVALKILRRVTMPPLIPSTRNKEAYEAFLRGRTAQVRIPDSPKDPRAVIAATDFQRAVELDPEFAMAWTRLAEARFRLSGYQNKNSSSPDSPGYAIDRAVELQPQLPLALCMRGFIRARGQSEIERTGRFVGSAKEEVSRGLLDLVRAEELGGATAETLMARFLVRWYIGESLDLLPLAHDALARDPENLGRLRIILVAMSCFGDYVETDRLCQQALALGLPGGTARAFVDRINNRQRWRGPDAALQLAETSPDGPGVLASRVHLLVVLGRLNEAVKLLDGADPKATTWRMYADVGRMERARELAAAELVDAEKKFTEDASEKTYVQIDGLRAALIPLEIALDLRESALRHLNEWRDDVEQRTQNRRSGGFLARMPSLYAALGEHEIAIALLQRRIGDGIGSGYELRDPLRYGSLQNDLRFQALQRQADAWAASQPEPEDSRAPNRK